MLSYRLGGGAYTWKVGRNSLLRTASLAHSSVPSGRISRELCSELERLDELLALKLKVMLKGPEDIIWHPTSTLPEERSQAQRGEVTSPIPTGIHGRAGRGTQIF